MQETPSVVFGYFGEDNTHMVFRKQPDGLYLCSHDDNLYKADWDTYAWRGGGEEWPSPRFVKVGQEAGT
jgi:hypothetical protein